jgi:ATP/maltotriose-dependent transcriptional regulator MalT
MKAAKTAGFYFNIAIPSRAATNSRVGILYVGSKNPESEQKMRAGQSLLIHLSSEILEWVVDQDHKQMLGDIELDITDQRIMRYSYQGFTAEQIAELCEIPLSRVRNRMRRQNEKFGTTSHKKTVNRAIEMDLLRMHECLSDTTPNQ